MSHRHRGRWTRALGLVLSAGALVFFPAIKADASVAGTQLWVARTPWPGGGFDQALKVAPSPDGSKVFVTGPGLEGQTAGPDYATVAYEASTGASLWQMRYNGPGNGFDSAESLAVRPDGSMVFVTGGSDGTTTDTDYATVAYNAATGARVWLRRYNGPGNGYDSASSLAVSPDGSKVFVTGLSTGSTTSDDFATVAYDALTGAKLWVRRYDDRSHADDVAFSVSAGPDGSKVFVAGESTSTNSGQDFTTVAYDALTGAKLWVGRYTGPGSAQDWAFSVEASPDGSTVLASGFSTGASSGLDYATVAYDASTGTRRWVRRYNGPGDDLDWALGMAVTPDGSKVFVTGGSRGSSSGLDYATIAYDVATGRKLWVRRHSGPGDNYDQAASVTSSPDGSRVYVTGSVTFASGTDYATFAYDAATGATLWGSRYDGPGHKSDDASSVGVSPDGSQVYVTGGSHGTTRGSDYATVAYEG